MTTVATCSGQHRSAKDAMNELETLGAHIARSHRARTPDAAREAVRRHLIDTVGAWIAGAATPEGQALMRFATEHRARGDDNRIENCSLDLTTYCALARLSEIDDIHLPSMITPGSIVVPGALTIAAGLANVDSAALTQAIIAGYDAMTRLGL